MIEQDKMRLLVIEHDGNGVTDVRDATADERVNFFAGDPEHTWFYEDIPFQGWGYVDEIWGPGMETIGYVMSKEARADGDINE